MSLASRVAAEVVGDCLLAVSVVTLPRRPFPAQIVGQERPSSISALSSDMPASGLAVALNSMARPLVLAQLAPSTTHSPLSRVQERDLAVDARRA